MQNGPSPMFEAHATTIADSTATIFALEHNEIIFAIATEVRKPVNPPGPVLIAISSRLGGRNVQGFCCGLNGWHDGVGEMVANFNALLNHCAACVYACN